MAKAIGGDYAYLSCKYSRSVEMDRRGIAMRRETRIGGHDYE